ncbi:MAG: urease accessory protein UreE [Neisseriales bacterium]|mgnify:FL=1|nr:MAG: urease accessory protein UreE [Neisseriales bacterium]HRG61947.1 urease accessory protein UreE [Burkholderiales bacterium]
MIITKICGNLANTSLRANLDLDYIELEWFELNKRIMRKTTRNNLEIGINISENGFSFNDQDILFDDGVKAIIVKVIPTKCIAINPASKSELAVVCYELGNRHASLFIDENNPERLLVPFDQPMLILLKKILAGVEVVDARLVKPLTGHKNISHEHHHH